MLTALAAQADEAPGQAAATWTMDAAEQALEVLRRTLQAITQICTCTMHEK